MTVNKKKIDVILYYLNFKSKWLIILFCNNHYSPEIQNERELSKQAFKVTELLHSQTEMFSFVNSKLTIYK